MALFSVTVTIVTVGNEITSKSISSFDHDLLLFCRGLGQELRPLWQVQRRVEGQPHRQARRRLPYYWGNQSAVSGSLANFTGCPFWQRWEFFRLGNKLRYSITIVILHIKLKFTKFVNVQLTHKIPTSFRKGNPCPLMIVSCCSFK